MLIFVQNKELNKSNFWFKIFHYYSLFMFFHTYNTSFTFHTIEIVTGWLTQKNKSILK